MERIVAAMDQHDSREHEAAMRAFIEKARTDDLVGMMALTSRVTIKKTGGEEKQRQHYLSDTIPALKLF
jgi:LDH2 family malate/lactate/ureidoglycolate dehydrogenase